MPNKRIYLFLISLCFLFQPFSVEAQENTICGHFQNDGYYFYTFYPYNGYQPVPSQYSEDNFYYTFGFPVDQFNWVVLYNPWINRAGELTGFDSFEVVSTCTFDSDPIPAPEMYFSADATTLYLGECTTLYWGTAGYDKVFLQTMNGTHFIDDFVPYYGNATICPEQDSAYRLIGYYDVNKDFQDIPIQVIIPTNTPRPTSSPVPPTKTIRPPTDIPWPTNTPKPISTLIVKPPTNIPIPTQESNNPPGPIANLGVIAIRQALSPAVSMNIAGITYFDEGFQNCYIASVSMALEYFEDQGILTDTEAPDYRELVSLIRNRPPDKPLLVDPAIFSRITNNKLTGTFSYVDSDKFLAIIDAELMAGRPVLTGSPNGQLLGHDFTLGHSIIINGHLDGRVYYMDPWDGASHSFEENDFIRRITFDDKNLTNQPRPFVITISQAGN